MTWYTLLLNSLANTSRLRLYLLCTCTFGTTSVFSCALYNHLLPPWTASSVWELPTLRFFDACVMSISFIRPPEAALYAGGVNLVLQSVGRWILVKNIHICP